MNVAGHPVDRHVGQFRDGLLEQHDVSGEQSAQQHAGCQLAAEAQVPNQRADFLIRCIGRESDSCLFAGLASSILGVLEFHPLPCSDKTGKRLRELG